MSSKVPCLGLICPTSPNLEPHFQVINQRKGILPYDIARTMFDNDYPVATKKSSDTTSKNSFKGISCRNEHLKGRRVTTGNP